MKKKYLSPMLNVLVLTDEIVRTSGESLKSKDGTYLEKFSIGWFGEVD